MRGIGRIGLALAAILLAAAAVEAQSLASLAKKNKSGRKAPASRTFTNKDLQQASGAVSTSRVPDNVQAAAKPSGNVNQSRKAAPPPAPASSAGNQMTPVAVRPSVPTRLGGG